MKYTILGFQQEKALKLGLKTDDLLLLRAIKDMYSSASMEFIIENNKTFMWVNQDYLMKEIPIIGSKRKLQRMLKNLEKLNLIERVLKHNKKGVKGNFSYIRPTIKLDKLQDYDPYDKMSQGYDKMAQPLRQNGTTLTTKCRNKDPSIIDPSIRDSNSSNSNREIEQNENFKEITDLFQQNGFGLITQYTAEQLIELNKEYSFDWLKEAMEIAVKANARNLRYVEGILKKWKANGKGAQNDSYRATTEKADEDEYELPDHIFGD